LGKMQVLFIGESCSICSLFKEKKRLGFSITITISKETSKIRVTIEYIN
jgi:exoribonuclease R